MNAAGPSTPVTRDSSLKLAFVLALTISFAAAAILFQSNVDPEPDAELGRSGRLGTGDQSLADDAPTATPLPTARPRSQAVVRAPEEEDVDLTGSAPPFPTLGRYIYDVQGTESASFAGSRRSYPAQMAMTVHRESDQQTLQLESDELIFDLELSSNHREREVVAYRKDGILFTFESGVVTIGNMTRNSAAKYSPAMLQIPIPVNDGDSRNGSSRAIGPNGTEIGMEDWRVEVHGTDQINALGETIDTFVVTFESVTRPGYDETTTRSRTYWLSPERSIWVKFSERLTRTSGAGLTRMSYNSDYTATLSRIEPLGNS